MVERSQSPAGSHALISLRLWFSRHPWQIAPAWALAAGIVLRGAWGDPATDLVAVILVLLLVDAVWGAVWTQTLALRAGFRDDVPTDEDARLRPGVPYAHAQAPFSRIWRWLGGQGEAAVSRDAWLALLLALALSYLLGSAALLASLAVALVALIATLLAPALPAPVRLLGAIVGVALPWWLGFHLLGEPQPTFWPHWFDRHVWFLLAAFTYLAYAQDQFAAGASRAWAWSGHVAVLAVPLVLGEPQIAGLAAILLLPPALSAGRGARDRLAPWHLLALLALVALLR